MFKATTMFQKSSFNNTILDEFSLPTSLFLIFIGKIDKLQNHEMTTS